MRACSALFSKSQALINPNLPHLPIPALQETADKFLDYVAPLISSQELDTTKRLVGDFVVGDGPRLQQMLEALDQESKSNWLEGFWSSMYLEARDSVAIHWNPSFVLNRDPGVKTSDSLDVGQRAARLVCAALQAHRKIEDGTFPPDPGLCMKQHLKLFGCTRIPGATRDTLHRAPKNSNHIVVLADSGMYKVDLDASEEQLAATFSRIAEEPPQASPAVELLTSLPRAKWHEARSHLMSVDPKNRQCLQDIDDALFLLSLDASEPSDLRQATRQMMHGAMGAQRWFDRWQIVVTPGGYEGFNLEHSPLDGHTFVSLFNHMWTHLETRPLVSSSAAVSVSSAPLQRLEWSLDRRTESILSSAHWALDAEIERLHLSVLQFTDFGTEAIKKHARVSPDAFMQLGFQLAHTRLTGIRGGEPFPSVYESCNTKSFDSGRTETIRSVTPESVRFCLNPTSATLQAAAERHSQRVADAKRGAAVDRHLFALHKLAAQLKSRLPDDQFQVPRLFEDTGYSVLTRSVLSTSNSGAIPFRVFSFAPVVPEGVGLGYQTFPEQLDVCVTRFSDDADKYRDLLVDAFRDMYKMRKD